MSKVMAASADDDQARCLYLISVQIDRGNMALVDLIAAYCRVPRPAPRKDVALDFGLFRKLMEVCPDHLEHAAWSGLLIGSCLRGDQEGALMVERLVRLRVATEL